MPVLAWDQAYPGLVIDISVDGMRFWSATSESLSILASKPVGKDLLSLISQRCKGIGRGGSGGGTVGGKTASCVITFGRGTMGSAADREAAIGDATEADASDWQHGARRMGTIATPGGGTPYQISLAGPGANEARATYSPYARAIYTRMLHVDTPAFVALGHELCHCLHILSGDLPPAVGNWVIREEARTVGAGTYKDTRISENAIRKEHNLPLRTYYSTPGDCNL